MSALKALAKKVARTLGYRPSYGNYGIERQEHLGGYWKGGDPHTWCPDLWSSVVKEFGIRSVIDVGCGQGFSTQFFKELGVEVTGVEGGNEAIETSPVAQLIVHHDYTKGPFRPTQAADLIWCCEFVEHVEERYVENFLATFAAGRYCLMTHAFPGQTGFHHVNLQPPEYWIQKLASVGFTHDPEVTERLRLLARDAKHVSRSLLFFSK